MSRSPLPLKLGLLPLLLFLLLGTGAALVVPMDYIGDPRPTPPDEGAHIAYIQHLLQHHALPVFLTPNDNYESHQPPLYYLSSVPAYALAQGLANGGEPLQRGIVLGVRLWSVLLAAISVWIAWLLGRRFFGCENLMSLAPAFFLALWPGRLMIVTAVTNDGLAEAMCLLTFYLCIVILEEGLQWRRGLLLGLAWSLALLSKSTSMALAPVILLALAMRHTNDTTTTEDRREGQTAQLLATLAAVAVPVLILTGWWFVRNQMLYGDPLAARVFEQLFSKDRATPDYFMKQLGLSGGAYFSLVVINTALSFWGVYGQANVFNPLVYYLTGFGIWAAALVGLVRQKLIDRHSKPIEPPRGRKGQPPPAVKPVSWQHQGWVLTWVLLVVVVAFFLRFNTSFYQAQARYLFAASGPLALLIALGLWDLHRPRWGRIAACIVLTAMLVMAVWSVAGYDWLTLAHLPPPLFSG